MKKIIYFFSILLFYYSIAFSQDFCVTTPSVSNILQSISPSELKSSGDSYVIHIYIHIIRKSNGTGGQTLLEVNTAVNTLITDYSQHNICFSLLGIDEIMDDDIYNRSAFGTDDNNDGKFDSFNPNSHSNAIDIYLFANEKLNFGLASGIPGTALVIGGQAYGTNLASSHVLSHEMGHCLGLYHTFHGLCEFGCSELVDGSNCSECGDFVCDTPADPQKHQVNSGFCTWNELSCSGVSNVDENGDHYTPNINLFMAYVPPHCMQYFTDGQVERMKTVIENSLVLQDVLVQNDIIVSEQIVNSEESVMYDALNTITVQSGVLVSEGAVLQLKAGEVIILQPGFQAVYGSNFTVSIGVSDCDNTAKNGLVHTLNGYEQYGTNTALDPLSFENSTTIPKSIDALAQKKITIFPNPNNGSFTITNLDEMLKIEFFNMIGQNVFSTKNIENSQITLPDNVKGTLFVRITTKDQVITQKMIVY
ncbi:MAG: zinc-dependent metalloprotease [Bacteroidales bacterium]|jgi:hypothetical protein|nr:zinc-dependent metalloprotease [Bacteroidales bacterium]